jgi:single-stranded-DNA-specific exonuclease
MTLSDGISTPVFRDIDEEAGSLIAGVFRISDTAARIITARGVRTLEDAGRFLYPRHSSMYSPFLLDNIVTAVERIRSAIEHHEKVAIFSDSDLDGLTSLAVVQGFLEGAGVSVAARFPTGEESYGLTAAAINEFRDAGVTLLVTLDCGIRDVAEIALGRSFGIDCIVCDHHEQGPELPDAIIVDPKLSGSKYPFRELAGVGVAVKLCHALVASYLPSMGRRYLLLSGDEKTLKYSVSSIINGICEYTESFENGPLTQEIPGNIHTLFHYNISAEMKERLSKNDFPSVPFEELMASNGLKIFAGTNETLFKALELPSEYPSSTHDLMREVFFDISFIRPKKIRSYLSRWLPLAAIGTVADIVPVLDENRIIVAKGLEEFDSCEIPAIAALAGEFPSPDSKVISWRIAPLLNTPGRIGRTELAADFFSAKDITRCVQILSVIRKLNEERRKSVKDTMSSFADEIARGEHCSTENFIYVTSDRVIDGFTGLVAGRIADLTGKPAIVVSDDPTKDMLKGSGRSPDGIDFLSCVEPLNALFERFGGHSCAFGFSAKREALDSIMKKIDESMNGRILPRKKKMVDLKVEKPYSLANFFRKDQVRLKPFGAGQETPLFFSEDQDVISYSSFGNGSKHGKFILEGGLCAIGWELADEMQSMAGSKNGVSFCYTLEDDPYNGRIRLVVDSLHPTV